MLGEVICSGSLRTRTRTQHCGTRTRTRFPLPLRYPFDQPNWQHRWKKHLS